MRAACFILAVLGVTFSLQAAARSSAAGVTNTTFSASHGTQVEYVATDGNTYLWYPGNATIVRGHWRKGEMQGFPAICFAYQANSYNPATGSVGGQWECEPTLLYSHGIVDQNPGDVFGLRSRSVVPFSLQPERTTLRSLLGQE